MDSRDTETIGFKASSDDKSTTGEPTPESAATKQIAELEVQLKDKDSKYIYLYSEFENFKKRAQKERSDLLRFGWESAARELLLVLDNFKRALEHVPEGTDKNLTEGLNLVITQFDSILRKQGVEPIVTANQPFDPNLHEAIGQEPNDAAAGTVVREMMMGYTLNGRLLRPARVIISAGRG